MIILAIIFDFIFGDENLVKKLTINEQKVRKTTKNKQNPKVTAYKKARKMQVCACSTAGLVLIGTVNWVSIELQTENIQKLLAIDRHCLRAFFVLMINH